MGIIRKLLDAGKSLVKIGKENAPVVLQIVSTTGTVMAVIFAVRAGPKAVEAIAIAENEKGEELTIPEKVGATWKIFVPTTLATGVAIGGGWASLHSSAKQNATLAGALASADLALAEYQSKTREIVGEKKEREIQDEVRREKAKPLIEDGSEPFPTGDGEDIFIDAFTGTKFRSSVNAIDRACIRIQEELLTENEVCLNDLRYEMGLGPVDIGDNAVFTPDNKPKYEYTYTAGQPYIIASFAFGCKPKIRWKGDYLYLN